MRTFLLLSLCTALLAPAAMAQGVTLQDDGSPLVLGFSSGAPGADAPGSLTTLFASNNQFSGNMVDLTPAVDMKLTAIDINVSEVGGTATIEVWYRNGTSFGNELNQLGDWILMGTFSSAPGATMGIDQPTHVDISSNSVLFQAGNTYGFFVNLTSYLSGVQALRYTNGGPNTYANADLSLLTNCGKGTPGFSGSTFFPRQLNATIYYDTQGGGLNLSLSGTCGGQMTATVSGATPNGAVAVIRAFGTGSVTIPPGNPCAGTTLGLNNTATLAGTVSANASGVATLGPVNVPAAACGNVYAQALDVSSCAVSNVVLVQ